MPHLVPQGCQGSKVRDKQADESKSSSMVRAGHPVSLSKWIVPDLRRVMFIASEQKKII